MRPPANPFDAIPALRADLVAVPAPPDRVLLVGDREQHLLQGPAYGPLLAALDGRRTLRQLVAALPELDGATALYLVDRLRAAGLVVDGPLPPDAAFWQAGGLAPPDPAVAALTVETLAPHDAAALTAALTNALTAALTARGVPLTADAPRRVVLAPDPLDPRLAATDAAARAAGHRWLPLTPLGARWQIGPTLGDPAGPCWQCLADRLRLHRPVHRWLTERGIDPPAPPATHPPLDALAPALWRWATGADPFDRVVVELDPFALTAARHPVVRRPQCPGCGDPALIADRAARPIVLAPRPVAFDRDGGHRVAAPDESWARLRHHVDPITGVVARLGPLPARDAPDRPVYAAASPLCPRHPRPGPDAFRQLSMGKGRTRAQARMSALGEAIERYAAVWQGDEAHHEATAAALGDAAVLPARLQHFSAAQYAAAGPDGQGRGARRLAAPYHPDTPLWWTPSWSLTHRRTRWLPTAWCYREVPRPGDRRHVIADSNGRAAGNCLEEAILQGFLELVERDAVAIWWYTRVPRPAFDLDAFGEPWFGATRDHFDAIGWDLWCLDLTHDLGLPVCVALARERSSHDWCVGFGCHLDPRLAVMRALTELCQLFDPTAARRAPWDALDDDRFLMPHGAPRGPADFEDLRRDDVRDAVELCVARAARAGLETLALDLSRPDIELSVALVCVPGLRHFWPRFGPGRLYTVPVTMGWRDAPLDEGDLNPVPLFL